jgi:hypothetical protein
MNEIAISIIRLLKNHPGLSDRELTDAIRGRRESPQYTNQNCRELESRGIILRQKRDDGLIGNWLVDHESIETLIHKDQLDLKAEEISEKKIKIILENYLTSQGWSTEVAWGDNQGVDIEARRGKEHWVIEVKGSGDYKPVLINYFHSIFGEIIQRMDNPLYKYSVALPDIDQFRRLWERVPILAKTRLGVTAIFVNLTGNIAEIA